VIDNAHDLIASLGGRLTVRRATGVGASAISNWLRLGIPRRRWPELIELGAKRGIGEAEMLRALRRAERDHAVKNAA
jgi:hypothetical protein